MAQARQAGWEDHPASRTALLRLEGTEAPVEPRGMGEVTEVVESAELVVSQMPVEEVAPVEAPVVEAPVVEAPVAEAQPAEAQPAEADLMLVPMHPCFRRLGHHAR